MAISPPSDIVLDVAQAADPTRARAAAERLAAMASGAGGPSPDFAAALDAARGPASTSAPAMPAVRGPLFPPPAGVVQPARSPYRKFEAVLLQQFIGEIMPKDTNLFGDAASADICRSLLAEQLANQLSKTGAFGIARMVEKAEAARHPQAATPAAPPEAG